jgi:NTP pyrophosphatase (non-canonical NTP hydrolase)
VTELDRAYTILGSRLLITVAAVEIWGAKKYRTDGSFYILCKPVRFGVGCRGLANRHMIDQPACSGTTHKLLSSGKGIPSMNVDELNKEVREFCEERDWTQFHTPKNLAIGLSTESNELLELFRFKNQADQEELLADSDKRTEVEEELADILFFTLRFADLYDINLEDALEFKLEKNRERYPEDEYRGSNKKYDE